MVVPGTIQNTWGASLVGQLLNTMLTGVELVQIWIYCWNYWNKDRIAFKLFIVFLIVIDMLCSVMGAYSFYWYLVVNFGNVQNLQYRLWAITLQTILNGIPGTAVQLYYTRRVYLVSQSIIGPIIMVPIILFANFMGFYIVAKAAAVKENYNIHISVWLPRSWMSAIVLADILITASLCWALYRKKTGFARTDSMITILIAYAINSGLLLTALGVAMTISFWVAPNTYYWVAFSAVMSKCYINSLFTMLNTRDHVRHRSTMDRPDNSYNLSSIRLEPTSEAHGSKYRPSGITVTVHRSTTSDCTRSKFDHTLGPTFEVSEPV